MQIPDRREQDFVGLTESRNRAVVDVVGAGDLPDWFARLAPLDRFRLLMRGEFWLAPQLTIKDGRVWYERPSE